MVDAMRKQLDALMGIDRNGVPAPKKHFTDPDICASYLVGLCPHELFNNTKMDLGDCPRVHSLNLKQDYDEARKKKDYGLEYNVEMQLQRYVEDCDRKIKRNIKHLEDIQVPDPEDKVINQQVKELMDAAERLGEEGKVEESLEFIRKAEELKNKKTDMTAAAASIIAMIPSVPEGGPTATQHQKLRVDKRLSDHFGGKLHIGYLTLREKYKELKDNRLKQREDRLQYINYSNDRSSYYERQTYRVGEVDDSFERDLERIRQRQREKQRREQEQEGETDNDSRDNSRPPIRPRNESPPPPAPAPAPPLPLSSSSSSLVDDYDNNRERGGGRNERYGRRERIDYDRPPGDYDRPSYSSSSSRDYDRPYSPPSSSSSSSSSSSYPQSSYSTSTSYSASSSKRYRDYDLPPTRKYRDYDEPERDSNCDAKDYDKDYERKSSDRDYDRDYGRNNNYRDYDGPRDSERDRDYGREYRSNDYNRNYDDRDRDNSDGEIDYDRRGNDNLNNTTTRKIYDKDYDDRDRDRGYESGGLK